MDARAANNGKGARLLLDEVLPRCDVAVAHAAVLARTSRMVIEFTDFERPRRLGSSTHMSSVDFRGALTFDPVAGGTRMRWTWEVQPRGLLKILRPLLVRMGRRQEQSIWSALKRYLEQQP